MPSVSVFAWVQGPAQCRRNTTSWSEAFRPFKSKSNAADTRMQDGLLATSNALRARRADASNHALRDSGMPRVRARTLTAFRRAPCRSPGCCGGYRANHWFSSDCSLAANAGLDPGCTPHRLLSSYRISSSCRGRCSVRLRSARAAFPSLACVIRNPQAVGRGTSLNGRYVRYANSADWSPSLPTQRMAKNIHVGNRRTAERIHRAPPGRRDPPTTRETKWSRPNRRADRGT